MQTGLWAEFSLDDFEPDEWFVVFYRKSETWWVNWLAFGRFKHVGVVGYVKNTGCWLFYDFFTRRMRLAAVTDADFPAAYVAFAGVDSVVVKCPGKRGDAARSRPRLWMNCVSMAAHLLGVPACALRPDGLYRHLLANGCTILEPVDEAGATQGIEGSQASA